MNNNNLNTNFNNSNMMNNLGYINNPYMWNNANNMLVRNQLNSNLEANSEKIIFFTQPPNQPIYPNVAQHQALLGTPLIPVSSIEKQISATENFLQIIEEVKREKEKLDLTCNNINNIYLKYKSNQKCDLHPKQLSDKCRKCKEIKGKIEKELVEKNKINDHLSNDTEILHNLQKTVNQLDNELSMPPYMDLYDTKELSNAKLFKVYGDQLTCNMNSLILNNILSCQYFKEVIALKGFNDILEEIVQNVSYVEPWAVGTSGVPSTLFCCLYKLMLLKLTETQVQYLISSPDSPYIRCAGFLFIRYLADPKNLWERLSPFFNDTRTFFPTPDRKYQVKIGVFVENLINDYDYYGTRLPRIPTTIERDIKVKMLEYKNKEREKDKQQSKEKEVASYDRERKHHKSSRDSKDRQRNKHNKKSRSRSRSSKNNIYKKIKEQEKESALAKGRDYAQKPTSYKSSLSSLPGKIKRRSNSPSPIRQNIQVIERKTDTSTLPEDKITKRIEYSKEFLNRQERLKKQYGSGSSDRNQIENSSSRIQKKTDENETEIMRLG